MAATTSGALKAAIEAMGLGLAVYRDVAPSRQDTNGKRFAGVPYPFVTVMEALSVQDADSGDFGDPAAVLTGSELVQVDLWQRWRDGAGKPAEQYGLPDSLFRKLRGAALPLIGTGRVYGVARVSRVRLLEPADDVVHDAFTCTVYRQL